MKIDALDISVEVENLCKALGIPTVRDIARIDIEPSEVRVVRFLRNDNDGFYVADDGEPAQEELRYAVRTA